MDSESSNRWVLSTYQRPRLIQILGLSVNLLLLLALTHLCFPRARQLTRKFFQLSYLNPSTEKYTLGQDDISTVVYWIIVLTGSRAAVMDYILMPIAKIASIEKKMERLRFAEQAWVLIYETVFFSLGMVRCYPVTKKIEKRLTQKTVFDVYVQVLARSPSTVGGMARQRIILAF